MKRAPPNIKYVNSRRVGSPAFFGILSLSKAPSALPIPSVTANERVDASKSLVQAGNQMTARIESKSENRSKVDFLFVNPIVMLLGK